MTSALAPKMLMPRPPPVDSSAVGAATESGRYIWKKYPDRITREPWTLLNAPERNGGATRSVPVPPDSLLRTGTPPDSSPKKPYSPAPLLLASTMPDA